MRPLQSVQFVVLNRMWFVIIEKKNMVVSRSPGILRPLQDTRALPQITWSNTTDTGLSFTIVSCVAAWDPARTWAHTPVNSCEP